MQGMHGMCSLTLLAVAGEKLQKAVERSQQEKQQLDEQLSGEEQKVAELQGKNKDLQQQV